VHSCHQRSAGCAQRHLGKGLRARALLFVDVHDVALVGLLNNDRDTVRILVADPPSFLLALLCGITRGRGVSEPTARRRRVVLQLAREKAVPRAYLDRAPA
jgi:hypothetical protein